MQKTIVRFVASAYLIGQASRMIVMHYISPGTPYFPITFDIFFDWIPMLVLGVITLRWATIAFYNEVQLLQTIKYHKRITGLEANRNAQEAIRRAERTQGEGNKNA